MESIVELRFDSKFPDEAIFGIIYSGFQNEYGNSEKLPILQLPETIRSKDPNLIHKPHYRLKNKNYVLQVGPKVFSLANTQEYVGWNLFSKKITETFDILSKLSIINKIFRFGLRYINLIENLNIYKESKLTISLDGQNLNEHELNLTSRIKTGIFMSRLLMVNNAEVSLPNQNKIVKGSVIDIDVVLEKDISFNQLEELLNEAHNQEKELFFSLLKPEYLATLNPQY